MNAELFCLNIFAWSVQMALLIATGGLLCIAFRMKAPRPKLLFLHGLLAISVLVPLTSMRQARSHPGDSRIILTSGRRVAASSVSDRLVVSPVEVAAGVLLGGVVIRFAWLGLGLLRLARLRSRAISPGALPFAVEEVRRDLGVFANFLVSSEISGPVTFGFRRPTVVVSAGFIETNAAEQRAIACHELLHLRRNDWLFTLAEETIRGLFWFHPAIWWLLGQIQLTREQVVDQDVIEYTRDRQAYVAALLTIAAARMQADVVPAPLFLAKRHLAKRVASIHEGVRMSSSRIASRLAGMIPLLAVAAVIGWQSFPLTAAPQAEPIDAPGVEVSLNGYRVLHRAGVEYPRQAMVKFTAGEVLTAVTVDDKGDVTDAKIVTGPPPLRNAVLQSVLQWHFDPDQALPADRTLQIAVHFTLPARLPAEPGSDLTIGRVDVSRLPAALQQQVAAALRGYEGESVPREQLGKMEELLRQVDSRLTLAYESDGTDHVTVRPMLSSDLPGAHTAAIVRDSFPPPQGMRIRVGGNVQATNIITKVTPVYPPAAKQARLQGTVRLDVLIGTGGDVKGIQLVSGHPMLVQAAVDAVEQWVYRPTLLNGNPIEVLSTVDVNFTLAP